MRESENRRGLEILRGKGLWVEKVWLGRKGGFMVVKGRWVISGEMLLRVLGGGEGEEVIGGF